MSGVRPDQIAAAKARLDDLRFMAATGETYTGAAARLGVSVDALERWVRNNPAARPIADRLRANGQPRGHVRAGRVGVRVG